MAKFTIQDTFSILRTAAQGYRDKLSFREFRLVYDNGNHGIDTKDIVFKPEHFKHLTGIKTKMDAGWFYEACLNHRLSPDDIVFDKKGNTQRKLEVIRRVPSLLYSPCWIGESSNNDVYIHAWFYVGDTKCVISLGFREKAGKVFPVTLKKESVRLNVKKVLKVRAVAVRSFRGDEEWQIAYCEKEFSPDEWL